jgi:hypothetical protein
MRPVIESESTGKPGRSSRRLKEGGPSRRWAVSIEALSRRRRPHAQRGGDSAWHSGPRFGAASLGDEVHADSDEGSTRSGSSGTRVWRSGASAAAMARGVEKRVREWRKE